MCNKYGWREFGSRYEDYYNDITGNVQQTMVGSEWTVIGLNAGVGYTVNIRKLYKTLHKVFINHSKVMREILN